MCEWRPPLEKEKQIRRAKGEEGDEPWKTTLFLRNIIFYFCYIFSSSTMDVFSYSLICKHSFEVSIIEQNVLLDWYCIWNRPFYQNQNSSKYFFCASNFSNQWVCLHVLEHTCKLIWSASRWKIARTFDLIDAIQVCIFSARRFPLKTKLHVE